MSASPTIIIPDQSGWHNKNITPGKFRHRDLSTIVIVPCYSRGIHPLVVQNWRGLMMPMNQKVTWIFVTDMEVGMGYSTTIDQILAHPDLSTWKYILTLEHDNLPPPDGLLRLYDHSEEYDAIGGLYFTKGYGGQPMCYGNLQGDLNFAPFLPSPDQVVPCRGLGMGFTLFRLDMFKDKRLPQPLFQTVQNFEHGKGGQSYTQDLWFFQNAGRFGYRFACDARVKVGHYDFNSGITF